MNELTPLCLCPQEHNMCTDIRGESNKCENKWNKSPGSTSLVKDDCVCSSSLRREEQQLCSLGPLSGFDCWLCNS